MKPNMSVDFASNFRIANSNRAAFALDGVTVVSLMGPAGAGKTSAIETIVRELKGSMRIGAVIGTPAAVRGAERLARQGVRSVAVRTESLTSLNVRNVLAELDLARKDLVFIDCLVNAISPAETDLGQDIRVAVFSVTDGDHQAAKYGRLVAESDLVLLTKVDLLPFVDFDIQRFTEDLQRINPSLPTLHFSVRNGTGVQGFVNWLAKRWAPDKQFGFYAPRQYSETFSRQGTR
jgi:hydrogenase nickel incorporation protein HypB